MSYGLPSFGYGTPAGNPQADGGVLIGELAPDELLVTGYHARLALELAAPKDGEKTQLVRVEEGFYRDGAWHFVRVWNGDQTDYGLNFTSGTQVLHVRLATY